MWQKAAKNAITHHEVIVVHQGRRCCKGQCVCGFGREWLRVNKVVKCAARKSEIDGESEKNFWCVEEHNQKSLTLIDTGPWNEKG